MEEEVKKLISITSRFVSFGRRSARGIRIIPISLLLCISLPTRAQQDEISPTPESQEDVEEIVVTGERYNFQLRLQMMEAEKAAYDIFNEFNDERRFDTFLQQATAYQFTHRQCEILPGKF